MDGDLGRLPGQASAPPSRVLQMGKSLLALKDPGACPIPTGPWVWPPAALPSSAHNGCWGASQGQRHGGCSLGMLQNGSKETQLASSSREGGRNPL